MLSRKLLVLLLVVASLQLLSAIKVYDKCYSDAQCQFDLGILSNCTVEGEDTQERCRCDSDKSVASSDLKKCLELHFKLEQACEESTQCKVPDSSCDLLNWSLKCICTSYFYGSDDLTQCVPRLQLGDSCQINKECPNNGTCDNDHCSCSSGFVGSENKKRCLELKHLSEKCEEQKQCNILHSTCEADPHESGAGTKRCYCDPLYYESKDKLECILKKGLGANCSSEEECLPENTACSAHVCSCDNTHYEENKVCVEKKALGGTCQSEDQCKQPNSICNNKICTCSSDFFPWTNPGNNNISECLPKKYLGSKCTNAVECRGNQSTCDYNGSIFACNCRDPHVESDSGTDCLPKKNLDEACTDKNQCLGVSSEATCDEEKKTCVCNPGSVISKVNGVKMCFRLKNFGEQCEVNEQCNLVDGLCMTNICHCAEDKIPVLGNTKCLPGAKINEKCEDEAQCLAEDSLCVAIDEGGSNMVCSCNITGFVGSDDGLKCVQVSQMDATCTDSTQCAGATENSECVPAENENKRCACSNYSVRHVSQEKGKRCLLKMGLNGGCEVDEQCNVKNSGCSEGKCSCEKGFKSSGKGGCTNAGSILAAHGIMLIAAFVATIQFSL